MAKQGDASSSDDGSGAGPDAENRLREPLQDVFARVPDSWKSVTTPFLTSQPGTSLVEFVNRRVADGAPVYPARVLRALEFRPPEQIRVVILGQDPYHGAGQAQGLAFSVRPGQSRLPPSLRNILKEVQSDLGRPAACRDDLSAWAQQGVLLLNSTLTVEDGLPLSHAGRGWEVLSDAILQRVASQSAPVAFMLWGASAQRKRSLIESSDGSSRHLLLMANHPSPLAASRPPIPFLGCRHFSLANAFLEKHRRDEGPIRW